MMPKVCCQCKLIKPSNDYYRRTRAKDGLQSACKSCTSKNKKKYSKSEEGRAKWNQYQNERNYLKKHGIEKEKKEPLTDEEFKENKQIINKRYYLKNRIDKLVHDQDLLILTCIDNCENLENINIKLEKMYIKLNELVEMNLY